MQTTLRRVLIWDLPTRLFHWTLALSFLGAWLTTEGDRWLSVHAFLGYLMVVLVVFRVLWGLVGSHYARFASFWFSPGQSLAYLKRVLARTAERHIGHNPTGSLAIYLLLLLTLVVGLSGFFTLGSEELQGVASSWTQITQSRVFKKLHELAAWAMLLLVLGHLCGVVVESWLHRENLARSMLTGAKLADTSVVAVQPHRSVAVLLLVALLGFGFWWFSYAVDAGLDGRRHRSEQRPEPAHVKFAAALPDNALWRQECGSCHLAFHPNLLPQRSWQRLMNEQAQHFGSDLALDAKTSAGILEFLSANSADHLGTEAAFKIKRLLDPQSTPLRITETSYWTKKHRNIAAAIWTLPQVASKTNCVACHLDAEAGTFQDSAMHLPPVAKP